MQEVFPKIAEKRKILFCFHKKTQGRRRAVDKIPRVGYTYGVANTTKKICRAM